MSSRYIFVYGTLKKGERAHSYLEKAYYIGEGEIEGFCLYDLGEYPGIKRCNGKVKGEVYLVDENTLKILDEYEGKDYKRIEVEVKMKNGRKIKAWCYEYLGEVKEENRILNDQWKSSKNNKEEVVTMEK